MGDKKIGRPTVDKSISLYARISENTMTKEEVEIIEKEINKGMKKSKLVQDACRLWVLFQKNKIGIMVDQDNDQPEEEHEEEIDNKKEVESHSQPKIINEPKPKKEDPKEPNKEKRKIKDFKRRKDLEKLLNL